MSSQDTEYGEAQDFADIMIACLIAGATAKVAAESAITAFYGDGKWITRPVHCGPRLRQSVWRPIRDRILARDKYTCAYCNGDADCVDHVTPLVKGGSNSDENLVAACSHCNWSKGGKLLSEWRMRS